MKTLFLVAAVAIAVWAGIGPLTRQSMIAEAGPGPQNREASSGKVLPPDDLDRLLAPIALYPDQLLAQVLLCAMEPAGITALDRFLKSHSTLKGSELQDAALKDNFEPSFVALALFPQTVALMASQLDSMTRLGQAFTADRAAVFASIQRLRAQARDAGNLKTTPQQEVETKTTPSGQQVIIIEPANPQVVYVPQYNAQTVYVQPAVTTVVVEQNNSADAAIAGMIGFTAGIAIGAAVNNNYYYSPYGWHGGAYMYNDAWDDYYDAREDAREDWQDHREDLVEERGDRASTQQEQRTERQENRQEARPESQQQRTERQQTRQENRPEQGQSASTTARSSASSYESRGYTQSQDRDRAAAQERSGTRSDAYSGYSSGRSERAASARGQGSRSSSRSKGGGGRRR